MNATLQKRIIESLNRVDYTSGYVIDLRTKHVSRPPLYEYKYKVGGKLYKTINDVADVYSLDTTTAHKRINSDSEQWKDWSKFDWKELPKYLVNGKQYSTAKDIQEEYGIKNLGTVYQRISSDLPHWKEWQKL